MFKVKENVAQGKSISFIRHYGGYTGGHQKVRDYLSHFVALGWTPSLYLEKRARTNAELFDGITGVTYQSEYCPEDSDIVFLAGMDWQSYLSGKNRDKPVINLIQHVRHGNPEEPLFQFLKEPAIRLCVSDAVRQVIEPYANGPCHVIKMGHYIKPLKRTKTRDVYILANKQPDLGQDLAKWAEREGLSSLIHTSTVEHQTVIEAMASSRVTICLPHKTEGFYLPGIEAMYYSDTAVVPYCIANAEYFGRHANILMPDLNVDSITGAVLDALTRPLLLKPWRKLNGRKIALSYSLKNERKELLRCLNQHFR